MYKPPGAFARFVQTAGAVNGAGSARTLAIVGTGNIVYEVYNEAIERDADRATKVTPYDTLAHDNVFEIISVSSKQKQNGVFQAGTTVWASGTHFDIKENKYIVWKMDTVTANVAKVAELTGGSADFAGVVTEIVSGTKDYLVEDCKYKVEVVYVDATAGSYRIINENTQEIIGEYAASATANSSAIPGVSITVTTTFVDNGSGVSLINVGDYITIQTTAAKVLDTVGQVDLPNAGDVYYVSYIYKKPDAGYEPKLFFDYDDIVAEYGNYDVTASGKVINSLSLGAEIAFLNGASPIVCVQAKNDSEFEINLAINKLRKSIVGLNAVNTIVALTTATTVGARLMSHVIDMSSAINGKECMTYLGSPTGETSVQSILSAKSYVNERVVYIAPTGAYKDVKDLRTGKINNRLVNASYLAVGVAALGLKNDPAEPLTNKAIAGFTGLNTIYEESEMNAMAEAGVLILKQRGSNIIVRHGLTTSVANVNSAEITLVQIKDYVIESARRLLGELYVGNKLRASVVSDVQSSLLSILNQFISQEVILGFSGVVVKRSKDDPRQIDVRFEIEAIYPLNYIMIEFGFKS